MANRIAVIGGGASGMMAALTAAQSGAEVTIYEKKERIGQKILVTGNGRCNLSNLSLSASCYYSSDPEKLEGYLMQFGVEDTVAFFKKLGLLIKDRDGYLYPAAGQAALVLDVLRAALSRAGVRILTENMPAGIQKADGGFLVAGAGGKAFYDRVILCCGSFAGEKKQTKPNGYTYAAAFGHKSTRLAPALVQLRCQETTALRSVAGVRAEAKVSLYLDGVCRCRELGEVQLTEYGISGIPVFQLSRIAAYGLAEGKAVEAGLDFLPGFSAKEWQEQIEKRFLDRPDWCGGKESAESFLTGILHKKLTSLLLRQAGYKPDQILRKEDRRKIEELLRNMKEYRLTVTQTNPLANAQVCAGGIRLRELDGSLQSEKVPGLYLAGELLDVDGRCGGYNLQWAWTSGYIAGKEAAKSHR